MTSSRDLSTLFADCRRAPLKFARKKEGTILSTLTIPRVDYILSVLHAKAEIADRDHTVVDIAQIAETDKNFGQASAHLFVKEQTRYQTIYGDHVYNFRAVSPSYGRFLYMIARNCWAKRIVAVGTSTGLSTIYLAAALRDSGGGQLICSALDPTNAAQIRANLDAVGLLDLVEIREGDVLDTLRCVGSDVDILLLGGACSHYLPVLRLIEPFLNRGAAIIGENVFDPAYLDYMRDPENGYLSQPLTIDERSGREFAVRTA